MVQLQKTYNKVQAWKATPTPAYVRHYQQHTNMKLPAVKWNRSQWIHINALDEETGEWLKKEFNFHDLDIEACMAGKAQLPKHEKHPNYNFFILHFPQSKPFAKSKTRIQIVQLNVFIKKSTLITIANDPIPLIDNFYELLQTDVKYSKMWLQKGTGVLCHEIVDRLTDQTLRVTEQLGKRIDTIDFDLFQLERGAIEDISLTRRNLIITTTTIKPMIKIFTGLEKTDVPYLNGNLKEYWGSIVDHLNRISELLADYSELLDGLTEAFDILLTHRTNQVIKLLTIFSVILMPLTLLSGIYGMNLQLPLGDNPQAFGIIMLIMLSISVTMTLYFKVRRWL